MTTQAELDAAVEIVADLSRDEFYEHCETIGLQIREDHNCPSPRHPITRRQRDAQWAARRSTS